MHTTNTIPFDLSDFDVSEVNEYDELLVIHAHSTAIEAICPDCAQVSESIHSHYTRSPRDLPCNGRRVRLVLGVRRFRCSNTRCARKTFAEGIRNDYNAIRAALDFEGTTDRLRGKSSASCMGVPISTYFGSVFCTLPDLNCTKPAGEPDPIVKNREKNQKRQTQIV